MDVVSLTNSRFVYAFSYSHLFAPSFSTPPFTFASSISNSITNPSGLVRFPSHFFTAAITVILALTVVEFVVDNIISVTLGGEGGVNCLQTEGIGNTDKI